MAIDERMLNVSTAQKLLNILLKAMSMDTEDFLNPTGHEGTFKFDATLCISLQRFQWNELNLFPAAAPWTNVHTCQAPVSSLRKIWPYRESAMLSSASQRTGKWELLLSCGSICACVPLCKVVEANASSSGLLCDLYARTTPLQLYVGLSVCEFGCAHLLVYVFALFLSIQRTLRAQLEVTPTTSQKCN